MKGFNQDFKTKLYSTIEYIENNSLVEVVTIVKASSSKYYDFAIMMGAIFMAVFHTYFIFSPFEYDPYLIYLITLLSFVGGYFLVELIPSFKRLLISKKRKQRMVEIYGRAIFQKGGIRFTNDKIGVLIFVSLFEKTAMIIPDRGAETKVPDEEWQKIKEGFNNIFNFDDVPTALLNELQKCKPIFAEYILPIENDINELPDDLEVDL